MAFNERIGNIQVENARLIFKNFSGKQTQFNPEGRRNFCLILEDNLAQQLMEDGWNVRQLKAKDDENPPYYIPVSVSFKIMPPEINLISGKKMSQLSEETVGELDYAEIEHCDLVIRPYHWEVNGRGGIKAYLKAMYVTVYRDSFADKYAALCEGVDHYDDEQLPF